MNAMKLFDNSLLRRRIDECNWDPVWLNEKQGLAKQYVETLKSLAQTKEVSFQGEFLIRILEEILGYVSKSKSKDGEYNIVPEHSDSDGGLGFFNADDTKDCRVTIELKDINTHLDKKQLGRDRKETPVEQGYRYASKLDTCDWIIVSNFKEFRLYSKYRSLDFYERFDLEEIGTETNLRRFIFLLKKEHLISESGTPLTETLMTESQVLQEEITNKFYSEYRAIRTKLFDHLVENNPDKDSILILEKTQKILDRLVFVFFCEDSSVALLDSNLAQRVYDSAKSIFTGGDEKIWGQFKGLFDSINKGNTTVSPPINAYNGGLFAEDPDLDSLIVKDGVWDGIVELARYDFHSQLNVNVLGHIFENSIDDLEQIKLKLRGQEPDPRHSKRKKSGIYYTPEYVTRHIVYSAVGRILEEDPTRIANLKIVDIACGSGAFLNQAHSYLQQKYREYHEQGIIKSQDADLGGIFDYNPAEVDTSILLDNIYGVDLSRESVEITKLSLWLKTAKRDAPLQNLDDNIKCGNSLVNNSEIVGNDAFDYESEFRSIIKSGGFDAVVGNPPYVDSELMTKFYPEQREWLAANFDSTRGNWDLYIPFIEKGLSLLKDGGYLSFIVPNKWLSAPYGKTLRKMIHKDIVEIVLTDEIREVFSGVGVSPIIVTLRKGGVDKSEVNSFTATKIVERVGDVILDDPDKITAHLSKHQSIIGRVSSFQKQLGDLVVIRGAFTTGEAYELKEIIEDDARGLKLINTGTIDRYNNLWGHKQTKYLGLKLKNPSVDPDKFRQLMPKRYEIHTKNKIVVPGLGGLEAYYDERGEYIAGKSTIVISEFNGIDPLSLLAIINSRLIDLYLSEVHRFRGMRGGDGYSPDMLKELPIPNNTAINQDNVLEIIKAWEEYNDHNYQNLDFINSKYATSYRSLLDINLSTENPRTSRNNQILQRAVNSEKVEEQKEVHRWLNDKQAGLSKSEERIRSLENKINQDVYRLYGLSSEEISDVESNHRHRGI